MVTIKDVAREAKVSVATVSRVLNGSGPVSDETRRRIREVAGRMRYVPHSGARSLITSKTETLGVLLPDLYGEFFSEVIRGMDDTAQRNGFHLLISRAYADRHGIETAIRAMRGRVDGVVAMSPDLDAESLLNLPSTMATHASQMYARNLASFLALIVRDGELEPDWEDDASP